MLGGNDVGPRDTFQLLFVAAVLVLAAIINANIFGNIALLLQSMNLKSTKFQEKMEEVHEIMKNIRITDKLQDEIKTYITHTHTTLDHQQDLDKFLGMLSPSLKQEVDRQMFYEAISLNSVFRKHECIIFAIIKDMKTILSLPEEIIISQGDNSQYFYFLARGQ